MTNLEKIKELRIITGAGMLDVKKALDESDGSIDDAIDYLRKNGIAKAAKKSDRIAAEGIVAARIVNDYAIIIELNSETDYVAKNEKFQELVDSVFNVIGNNDEEIHGKADDLVVGDSTLGNMINEGTATIGEKLELRRIDSFKITDKDVGVYTHSNNRVAALTIADGVGNDNLRDISMQAAAMNPKFVSLEEIPEDMIAAERVILTAQYEESMAGKPANILENIITGALNKQLAEVTLLEQTFVKDPSKKVKDLLGGGSITAFALYTLGDGIEVQENNFAEEVMSQVKG
jgi:elongation factor Ts